MSWHILRETWRKTCKSITVYSHVRDVCQSPQTLNGGDEINCGLGVLRWVDASIKRWEILNFWNINACVG